MRTTSLRRAVGLTLVAGALLLALGAPVVGAAPRARSLGPGDHLETLVVGGIERELILHVPPGAAAAHRPLLLIYHGHGDTAQSTERSTDFAAVADRTGELVAFLQGVNDAWNEQAGGGPNQGVNDVAYTRAVIALLERQVSFDHHRIVAVGFSNGAEMVEDLGCKLAVTLAMVVPVEGELARSTAATCAPARPIDVYEVHGTADTAIYYDGGPIEGHGIVVLSAPRSVARWAALDRCAATPTTSRPAKDVKLTRYSGCRSKVHVTLRTLVGGVHVWGSDIGLVVAGVLPPA